MNITPDQIANLTNNPEFGGFGYLGHEFRDAVSDSLLAAAADQLHLTLDDVFLWANSRPGRHFMDTEPWNIGQFVEELERELPFLYAEVAAEKNTP